mgnify:CR=1 FL=1
MVLELIQIEIEEIKKESKEEKFDQRTLYDKDDQKVIILNTSKLPEVKEDLYKIIPTQLKPDKENSILAYSPFDISGVNGIKFALLPNDCSIIDDMTENTELQFPKVVFNAGPNSIIHYIPNNCPCLLKS